MNKRYPILITICLCLFVQLKAERKPVSEYVQTNGYIKGVSTVNFVKNAESFNATLLLHNRINLNIKPVPSLTFGIGMRNRIFLTNQQKFIPDLAKQLSIDNGLVDLSFSIVDKSPLIIHTMLDRLFIDWQGKNWNIRAGRQRLNWGINLTWNPNDIFNSYNFLDFDYEERPGTDALKFQYNFTSFDNIEVAFSPSRNKYRMAGAVKYSFNRKNYDFQVMAGNYQQDIFLGFGWAGNIRNAGFKGEISYFQNWHDRSFREIGVSASTTFDYAFKKGWYIAGSFLYNNKATDNLFSTGVLFSSNLSPKMLMPAKYNFLFLTSKQFNPITSASLTLVYSPILNLFIVNPTFSFSLSNNWDLDFIVQSFFANNISNKFDVLGNSFNMRARWSFSN